jgi:hypothetical protein
MGERDEVVVDKAYALKFTLALRRGHLDFVSEEIHKFPSRCHKELALAGYTREISPIR